jgi:mono/diheme cytochrome c family protein
MKPVFALLCACLVIASLRAQNTQDVVKRGADVFARSCTGYCHAAAGAGGGGAPRLAGRGFDEAYIRNVVTLGIPGSPMQGFAGSLSRTDLVAVVAYVATLNGVASPTIAPPATPGVGVRLPGSPVPPDAARGRDLFYDATRGFGRCSTCHEVNGLGIPVAARISKVPDDVRGLREIKTPLVSTVTMRGNRMPALVLGKGGRIITFYDLTTPPPVLVSAEPSTVTIAEGSSWRHASVIAAYKDDELESILRFLRALE